MDKLTTVQFASGGPQWSLTYKNLDGSLSYMHRGDEAESGRITG